jgi:hypothetical protein
LQHHALSAEASREVGSHLLPERVGQEASGVPAIERANPEGVGMAGDGVIVRDPDQCPDLEFGTL